MDYVPFAIDWGNFDTAALGPDAQTIKRTIFDGAANRWKTAVKGWPQPTSMASTGLRINVEFKQLPAAKREAAGRVEPTSLKFMDKPNAYGMKFPIEGTITIDLADKSALLARRSEFLDVVTHEIGHVLGIGMLSDKFGGRKLVAQRDNDWWYVGPEAQKQYAQLLGLSANGITGVPILIDASGTAFHWNDAFLDWELMSANLEAAQLGGSPGTGLNAISPVTLGVLADLGYSVNIANAEHFALQPPMPRSNTAPHASARGKPSVSRCCLDA